MDTTLALAALMRWLHMVSAVAVAGSVFFYVLALGPALNRALTAEQRAALREPLMRRWKMIVHPAILLFLVSGFYNYIRVTAPQHPDQPLYHALFGVKFLVSLGVFALAIVLTSTRPWSERWRERRGAWLLLAIAALAVVLIGGAMKVMPAGDGATPEAVQGPDESDSAN
jgi:uncharacterized membrane protein